MRVQVPVKVRLGLRLELAKAEKTLASTRAD
jgi:hypothetical protein